MHKIPKVVFLGATDLTESPQTNSMRYHKTVFCIQLETKKAQANFSISKIRDFQITEFYFSAISLRIFSSFIPILGHLKIPNFEKKNLA